MVAKLLRLYLWAFPVDRNFQKSRGLQNSETLFPELDHFKPLIFIIYSFFSLAFFVFLSIKFCQKNSSERKVKNFFILFN